MTTYQQRLQAGHAFEAEVTTALRDRGWSAEPFGQGQLSDNIRDAIRHVQTPVRWMPDIVAVKHYDKHWRLNFIDAKAGDKWRTTGNHDYETAAVNAAEAFAEYAQCPTWFVSSDWTVMPPSRASELGQPGPQFGNGSDTPYLLVRCSAGIPFDAIFGPSLNGHHA